MPRLKATANFHPYARKPVDALLQNAARNARRAAARQKRLDEPAFANEEEMRQRVTLTEQEMAAWNQIAAGRPMRNSTAVLQAIKMKMEMTFSKPAQRVEADNRVQIEIVNLGPVPDVAPPYTPARTGEAKPGEPLPGYDNPVRSPPVESEDAKQKPGAAPPDASSSAQP